MTRGPTVDAHLNLWHTRINLVTSRERIALPIDHARALTERLTELLAVYDHEQEALQRQQAQAFTQARARTRQKTG